MRRFFRRAFRRPRKEPEPNSNDPEQLGSTKYPEFTPQASAPGTHVCTSMCEGIASMPPEYHESIIAELTQSLGPGATDIRVRTEDITLTNFRIVPGQVRYVTSEEDERRIIEGSTEPTLGLSPTPAGRNPGIGFALPTTYKYPLLPKGHARFLRFGGLGLHPMAYMESHPLDNLPPYVAVSYYWDPTSVRRGMFVDMKSFSISETVLEVLNQVQASQTARGTRGLLWIDQICINQDDEDEKIEQIYLMNEIYSKAEEVFIWLGPTANESDVALENMQRVLAEMVALNNATITRAQVADDVAKTINEDHGQIYGHLFMRPWFRRLWTVQEALLARKLVVMCGYQEVDFSLLVDLAAEILRYGSMELVSIPGGSDTDIKNVLFGIVNLQIYQLRDASTGAALQELDIRKFGQLVTRSRSRQVTMPPDRVHALMGVAPRQVRKHMARSKPKQSLWKLYTQFAKCMLENDPEWYFLSSAPSRERPKELPSWVPNLNSQQPFVSEFTQYRCSFSAGISPETRHLVKRNITAEELTARGFRIDTVTNIVPQTVFTEEGENTRQDVAFSDATREWEEQCMRLTQSIYNLDQENIPRFYIDILLAQSAAEPGMGSRALDAYQTFALACRLRGEATTQLREAGRPVPERFRHMPDSEKGLVDCAIEIWRNRLGDEKYLGLLEFTNNMKAMCSGRPFIGTSAGLLGLGCPGVEVGDVICIIYGTTVPYVLRPRKDGAMSFVGDAYMHNAMNGEAFTLPERGPDEMIRIR